MLPLDYRAHLLLVALTTCRRLQQDNSNPEPAGVLLRVLANILGLFVICDILSKIQLKAVKSTNVFSLICRRIINIASTRADIQLEGKLCHGVRGMKSP